MTRKELKDLMLPYIMVESEVEPTIEFVRDLFEFKADELRRKEPYATKTIDRLVQAAHDVDDLLEYVNELEEN